MKALLVAISICFFSAIATGAGDNNQWGAPEEFPNLEEHSRMITACEGDAVPFVTCTVDFHNVQECIVGCAYPLADAEEQ